MWVNTIPIYSIFFLNNQKVNQLNIKKIKKIYNKEKIYNEKDIFKKSQGKKNAKNIILIYSNIYIYIYITITVYSAFPVFVNKFDGVK